MQHSTTHHSTAQHSTAQHSTPQHNTAEHSTTQQQHIAAGQKQHDITGSSTDVSHQGCALGRWVVDCTS